MPESFSTKPRRWIFCPRLFRSFPPPNQIELPASPLVACRTNACKLCMNTLKSAFPLTSITHYENSMAQPAEEKRWNARVGGETFQLSISSVPVFCRCSFDGGLARSCNVMRWKFLFSEYWLQNTVEAPKIAGFNSQELSPLRPPSRIQPHACMCEEGDFSS